MHHSVRSPCPSQKPASRLEWTEEQQWLGKHQSFKFSSFFFRLIRFIVLNLHFFQKYINILLLQEKSNPEPSILFTSQTDTKTVLTQYNIDQWNQRISLWSHYKGPDLLAYRAKLCYRRRLLGPQGQQSLRQLEEADFLCKFGFTTMASSCLMCRAGSTKLEFGRLQK